MKTNRFSLIAVGAALTLGSFHPSAVLAQDNQATASKDAQHLKIPSPLEEITQLSKSGVGDPVVLTYIKNSDRSYNLNAQDIINLRNQGVSAEVTSALIRRGAEVRQAAAEAYQQQQQQQTETATAAAAPTYQTAPAETVVVTPAPVVYYTRPASTVSVTYFGSPRYSYYSSCYPSYRYYGSGSYYNYAPRVSFGIGFGGGYRYGGFRSSARYCR
jgi:hypothetical protein